MQYYFCAGISTDSVCVSELYSLGNRGSSKGCNGSERTAERHRSITAELVEQATRCSLCIVPSFGGQQAPRHEHHLHHKQGVETEVTKIQTVQEISPDGQTFPTQPTKFNAEVLKQPQEMYANRPGITVDTTQILKATEKTPHSPLLDHPRFAALMYMYKRSRQGLPWEDLAGEAPTFDEFVDILHRCTGQAQRQHPVKRCLGV